MSAPLVYSLNESSTLSKCTQQILNNYLLNYLWENWGTKSLSDLDNWFSLNRSSVSGLEWQLSFAHLTYYLLGSCDLASPCSSLEFTNAACWEALWLQNTYRDLRKHWLSFMERLLEAYSYLVGPCHNILSTSLFRYAPYDACRKGTGDSLVSFGQKSTK